MKYVNLIFCILIFFSCKKELKNEDTILEKKVENEIVINPEEKTTNESQKIVFTVQIAALENQNNELSNLPNVKIYQENGLTKYRLGVFDSYIEAREFRKKILSKYEDAFVQALKNEVPINIQEALQ